jgi:hypothetical protein
VAGPPDPQSTEGPRVGLARYDPSDPIGTFQLIERVQPPPEPGPLRVLAWPLRVLGAWLVNLGALAVAGVLFTNVGPADPPAYVAWPVAFALLNVGASRLTARLWRGPLAPVISLAVAPLVANVLAVWLMTVVSPPVHVPDPASIAEAGCLMWLANLPIQLLVPRRVTRAG